MSHIDRQAQKVLTYALAYGANPKSMLTQAYIEEFAKMASSMAVAHTYGYIHLYHPDFSSLELRLHQFHDEQQVEFITHDIGPRGFSRNQRSRHWERKRKEVQVKVVPKTAQQLLDEDFANDNPSKLVHKMGKISKPPHRQSVACIVVQSAGNIQAHNILWTGVFQELFN
ncbi:hypothetical protein NoPa_00088 [Pseudomonas phage vB_PpuM-NoPa]|uniref:Uncharacterized protein n=1 Tax=Pseudomonas phage vB_PpuM-NoPa TaxID=3132619 RepID=A0AAX4MZ54_9CAUD